MIAEDDRMPVTFSSKGVGLFLPTEPSVDNESTAAQQTSLLEEPVRD